MTTIRLFALAPLAALTEAAGATPTAANRGHQPDHAAHLHVASDVFAPSGQDGTSARPVAIVQAQLALDLDLSRAGSGTTIAHISAVANNGASISDRLGDEQGASSMELGFSGVRLHEAWIAHDLHPNHQLRAGLIDLSGRIDQLDASAALINSAFTLGTDLGQANTDENGRMPFTAWGGEIESRVSDHLRLRGGLLFDMGRTNRIAGSDHDMFSSGEFVFAEGQVDIANAKILAGYWLHNARDADHQRRDDSGFYIRGETLLWRDADHPGRALNGFARFGTSDASHNTFDRFVSAGLQLTAPFKGRDDDILSAGVARAVAPRAKQSGTHHRAAETVYEAGYTAQISQFLSGHIGFQHIAGSASSFDSIRRSTVHLRLAFDLPLTTGFFR
ncbi:MAG: carbohydrate porin [Alphaproteobacteria bacterium]|nr:carbohydrate porin [Alphaproteobacteria bacterium]MBU0863773.1 carbohydrate porin [Alphaproteobacteria bacterium]MBU1825027.1 carbohydrate porin [Alphaproteobacteria bacterium]